ncbi:MAG: hypothetical protein AB3N14_04615, partial [Flavobacteriaceae bacterium]
MIKNKVLGAIGLPFLFATSAADAVENITTLDKVRSLIVAGYALKDPHFDKVILFNNVSDGCTAKNLGYYTFVDIEGGNVNRLKEYPLMSPSDSLQSSSEDYRSQVFSTLDAASTKYCIDVTLAPMVDAGYFDRSYFLEEYQIKNQISVPREYDSFFKMSDEKKRSWSDKIDEAVKSNYQIALDRVGDYLDVSKELGM